LEEQKTRIKAALRQQVQPIHVAAYIEQLGRNLAAARARLARFPGKINVRKFAVRLFCELCSGLRGLFGPAKPLVEAFTLPFFSAFARLRPTSTF
jgi:hypothetical protein